MGIWIRTRQSWHIARCRVSRVIKHGFKKNALKFLSFRFASLRHTFNIRNPVIFLDSGKSSDKDISEDVGFKKMEAKKDGFFEGMRNWDK